MLGRTFTTYLLLPLVLLWVCSCDSVEDPKVEFSEIDGIIWVASYMRESDATKSEFARMRFVTRESHIALLDSCNDPSWINWSLVGDGKLQMSDVSRPYGGFCYKTAPFDLISDQMVWYRLTRDRLVISSESTGATLVLTTKHYAPILSSGLIGTWYGTDDGFAPDGGWADSDRPVLKVNPDSTYTLWWDCSQRNCAHYRGILGVGYDGELRFYQRGSGNLDAKNKLNELLIVSGYRIEDEILLFLDSQGLITHKFSRSKDST